MGQPYVGEIRIFAGNFAPAGWMFCDGSILSISENDTLFNLIGTTYGGDGQSTFALPDLRGRLPLHMGNGGGSSYVLGQNGGSEEVTLTVNQMPSHSHPMLANSGNATTANAAGNVLAQTPTYTPYIASNANVQLAGTAIAQQVGGSQPHSNIQPFLCVDFIISLYGVYPSPT